MDHSFLEKNTDQWEMPEIKQELINGNKTPSVLYTKETNENVFYFKNERYMSRGRKKECKQIHNTCKYSCIYKYKRGLKYIYRLLPFFIKLSKHL